MTSRVPFQLGECLGKGGEAKIYALESDASMVAKLYHHPTDERSEKLAVMIDHPPAQIESNGHTVIAWPTKRIFAHNDHSRALGCLMPRVAAGVPAAWLHNMKSRLARNPHFNWRYLVRAAMNIALTFQKVHESGYVVGDVNDQGLLVTDSALVAIVDCDSFQVTDPATGRVFRCEVGVGPFTPAELVGCNFATVDRTANHDLFGLAVVIYQMLMGCHPYQVKMTESKDGVTRRRAMASDVLSPEVMLIEDCIRLGLYPDLNPAAVASPVSPPIEILPERLRALFRIAFGPESPARPTAAAWAEELWLVDREMGRCTRNVNHFFAGEQTSCPWCERTAWLRGRDPFPSPDAIRAGRHLKRPATAKRPWTGTPRRVSPAPGTQGPALAPATGTRAAYPPRRPGLPASTVPPPAVRTSSASPTSPAPARGSGRKITRVR